MTRAFIARVLRAWDSWRWKRRLPRPSAECERIAARMRAARGSHKATRQLRLADEAAEAAKRIRGYIKLLRELDAIAARQSQKIAAE